MMKQENAEDKEEESKDEKADEQPDLRSKSQINLANKFINSVAMGSPRIEEGAQVEEEIKSEIEEGDKNDDAQEIREH